jgi:hypothetical protein
MTRTKTFKITSVLFILVCLIIPQSVRSADQGIQNRPIPLGTSGGNIDDSSRSFCCGGTLGSLVQDTTGVQYILSNNHVLAKTNSGFIGEVIIQPGLIDQNPGCFKDHHDAVANLSDFAPISFRRNTVNRVDAAIAEAQTGRVDPSGFILNIGEVSNSIAAPFLGMPVRKNGRTSGLTTGTITAIDVTVDIQYGRQCGINTFPRTARFTGQIMIGPGDFSGSGDSGSLIVEDCSPFPRPVGLLFAGSDTNTLANPIGDILSELEVSMVGRDDFCSSSSTATAAIKTAAPLTRVNPADMENVIKVKRRNEENILKKGPHGIGVGISDTEQGRPIIEVYIKKPAHGMRYVIPEKIEDIPVKIVETDVFVAY